MKNSLIPVALILFSVVIGANPCSAGSSSAQFKVCVILPAVIGLNVHPDQPLPKEEKPAYTGIIQGEDTFTSFQQADRSGQKVLLKTIVMK